MFLAALKFLRRIVGIKDELYNRYITTNKLLQPVVKAFLGSDLKLTLQTAGEPKPNVKWTRNSDSFDDEEGYNVYEDDMGCHIEMSGLTADFSGKYTLTAVNLAGRATKSVMVQVLNDEKIYEAYKQFKRYVFITQFKK